MSKEIFCNESRENTGKMSNEQLVIRIKAGIDVADSMLQLWQQNIGIIRKFANKYSCMAEVEDLEQEGYLALCEAVEHYSPETGSSFLHYAVYWIKQGMLRYCHNNTSTVRVPVHEREKIRQYKQFLSEFKKHVGRAPTACETRYYTGLGSEAVDRLQISAEMEKIGSLEDVIGGEDDDLTVGDTVASAENVEDTVVDEVTREQLKEAMWELVDTLPGKQPQVIRMRYIDGLTLKETGKRTGLALESVRQQQRKAIRSLRASQKILSFWYEYDRIYSRALKGGGVERFNNTWTSSTESAALWDE